MPRMKKGRKSVPRIAPNTVFHQIAQRIRHYRLHSNSLPIAPASVRQRERVLAPSTLLPFSIPAVTPLAPRQPLPVELLASSPVSTESTNQLQNHTRAQMK